MIKHVQQNSVSFPLNNLSSKYSVKPKFTVKESDEHWRSITLHTIHSRIEA